MTMTAYEDALQRLPAAGGAKPTYSYYRQANGWITASPATEMEELKYRREGWTPLPQYGRFQFNSKYIADHPLEMLLMMGGAHELPYEQVIEMGFHLNPPRVPSCRKLPTQFHPAHNAACWVSAQTAQFPQLTGTEEGFSCRFCPAVKPTQKARDQHEGVAHKDEASSIRTGEVMADSMVKGFQGLPGLGGTAQPAVPTPLSTSGEPYVCGFCMAGFSNLVAFGKHVQEEQEARQ